MATPLFPEYKTTHSPAFLITSADSVTANILNQHALLFRINDKNNDQMEKYAQGI